MSSAIRLRVFVAYLFAASAVLPLLGSARAHAPRAFDLQNFQPAPGRGAAITLPSADLLSHGDSAFAFAGSYARGLLTRQAKCNPSAGFVDSSCFESDGSTAIMPDLVQLELLAAVGLYDVVELGVSVPGVYARVADDLVAPQGLRTRVGAGDLRFSLATPLLAGPLALGLRFTASLPTGDDKNLLGARSWTAFPQLVAAAELGAASLHATAGLRLRERVRALDLEQDEEADMALGAVVPLLAELAVLAELRARVGVGGERSGANENPLEGDLGVQLGLAPSLALSAGAGAGLWPGREGYGAPELRVFTALRWHPGAGSCRGFSADQDGCADLDGDRDGIEDSADRCPRHPEDRDGFADEDGCPDFDNDADGMRDDVDACPSEAEDRDGYRDDDGCPELDNDGDGVSDLDDSCPMEPEDMDGYEDGDGCPETGPEPTSVAVGEGRLLLSERIHFDYDRDTLREASLPALDRLAEVIMELPQGTVVMVEGHTDDGGNADYNLDLSYRRARAVVVYLRSRGVPEARLQHRGMGAKRPLVDDTSPAGDALNRRVEFLLVR